MQLSSDNTKPEELAALKKIKNAHDSGNLKVWVSQKSVNEAALNLENAGDDRARIEKWLSTLQLLDEFDKDQSTWMLDVSGLDTDTDLVPNEQSEEYNQICEILIGNKTNVKLGDIFDIAILYEHRLQGNELFVVRDNPMFRKTVVDQLFNEFDVKVVDSRTAIEVLKTEYSIEL